MFKMSTYATVALIICVVGTGNVYAQAPEGAREVAIEELKSMTEILSGGPTRSIFEGGVDSTELARATLEEAHFKMWAVPAEAILEMDAKTLLNYANTIVYSFPILIDDRLIGAIVVGEDKNNPGTFKRRCCYSASPSIERMLEVKREYPSKQGYSVVRLYVEGMGHYVVVEENSETKLIAPLTDSTAKAINLQQRQDSKYSLMPAEEALQKMKPLAKRFKGIK